MAPAAIVIGFGITTRWRADKLQRLWQHLWLAIIGSAVLGVLLIVVLAQSIKLNTIMGVALAVWIIWSNLLAMLARLRKQDFGLFAIHRLPLSFIGMCLAHIGFACTIIGITLTSQYSSEVHKRMGPGDKVELAGYSFVLESIQPLQGPNYQANEAVVNIYHSNELVTVLRSQKRIYNVNKSPMTEAGIDAGLTRDLYVSLGEPLGDGDWSMRFYHRPFIRWIWLGAIFMALGGLLAAMDKRYRIKSRIMLATEPEQVADGAVVDA